MAKKVTYEITVDNSGKIKAAMKKQAIKALTECGLIAEGYAKRLCPVDTGLLRNSITYAISGNEPNISTYKANKGDKSGSYSGKQGPSGELVCYIGTNVEYAPYIEYGTGAEYDGGRQTEWTYKDKNGQMHKTGGRKAQPFLRPAVADHKSEYEQIIKEEMQN